MPEVSRRNWLCTAAATGLALLSDVRIGTALPLGLPLGCQTYPVRKQIASDFPAALKSLAAAGFEHIELCSPVGYAQAGFAPVVKYKGASLTRLLSDFHLQCHSSHFSIQELRHDLNASIDWARSVGLTQMLTPSLDGPKNPKLDDVKRSADEFNRMGEQTAKAGIQLGLHNEDFELSHVDGKLTYDLLFGLLDPKLVRFQFQCSTISDGLVAADYFRRYPGRFISMHVQDWSPKQNAEVAVGTGVIDWRKTFAAAKIGGIQNYYVEMSLPLMAASVPYLRALKVS